MNVVLIFLPPTLGDKKHKKLIMDYLKAIDDLRKELKENRQVHEEIAQKYQVDLEVVILLTVMKYVLRKQQCNVQVDVTEI